jgi:hypothetical protein
MFNDQSTDNDGTIVNWTWDFGDDTISYGDKALTFDGNNDYIETEDITLDGSRTFEIWLKPDFSYDDGEVHEWLNWQSGNTYMHCFKNSNDKTYFVIKGSNSWQVAIDTIPFNTGDWHHFCGVYNIITDQLRLYWDGQLMDTSTGSGGLSSNPSNLYIGSLAGNNRWFNGDINDIRVYNRALSDSEIMTNYNTDSIITNGLVSWWKLDDQSNIITDSVGSIDGIVYGDALWTNFAEHQYIDADTYDVVLTVKDNQDALDTILKSITVSY